MIPFTVPAGLDATKFNLPQFYSILAKNINSLLEGNSLWVSHIIECLQSDKELSFVLDYLFKDVYIEDSLGK